MAVQQQGAILLLQERSNLPFVKFRQTTEWVMNHGQAHVGVLEALEGLLQL
jgi:hypothetical protein